MGNHTSPQRIAEIDIVRGFALFGVLLVNILAFAYPSQYFAPARTPGVGALNVSVEILVRVVAEGSFVTMFAFLFGLGMGMKGIPSESGLIRTPAGRRLAALFVLGILHGTLLWTGDILALFSVCGFFLIVLLRREIMPVVPLAAGGFIVSFLLFISQAYQSRLAPATGFVESVVEVYGAGSFADITARRVEEFFPSLAGQIVRWGPQIVGLFALGVLAARLRLYEADRLETRAWKRVLLYGLIVGIPIKLAHGVLLLYPGAGVVPASVVRALAVAFGGPALGFVYMVTLYRLLQRRAALRRRLLPLAAAGRMSLSVYISQSVIASFIFYGYGIGLHGRYGAAFAVPLAVGIYVVQIMLATAWLRWFEWGPLEWCVRFIMNGRLPKHSGTRVSSYHRKSR